MIVCGEKHDWNTEYYERSTFNGSYQDKDYYDYKTYVDKETFVKEMLEDYALKVKHDTQRDMRKALGVE